VPDLKQIARSDQRSNPYSWTISGPH